MPILSPITAEAFCTSIENALLHPTSTDRSINRIQKTLNGMPEGKLFLAKRGDNVYFITEQDGRHKYISKHSDHIYSLLRRRYLGDLMEILKLSGSNKVSDNARRTKLIARLQHFICSCERGNMNIARIVLTRNQYNWFTSDFRQKSIDKTKALRTKSGLYVRSKSERDIINRCDTFAVPLHYEEMQVVYVKDLVDELYHDLIDEGFIKGELSNRGSEYSRQLYSLKGNSIHWNVPAELQSMNATGSIWKTYYPPRGTVTMFNDIKSVFADGSLFLWEHAGLMSQFKYRFNASERNSVLKFKHVVTEENFLETYEYDVDTSEKVDSIIKQRILPRLWF